MQFFNTINPNNFEALKLSHSPHITQLPDSYFVTTSLVILVVLSLILTFYQKGTAVHKVIGLLLVSIFVVFLWIFKTQFLFVYLVYILAFISAVLMLFLSVVLMLPISTLNKNYEGVKGIIILPTLVANYEFIEVILLEMIFVSVLAYAAWRYLSTNNSSIPGSVFSLKNYGVKWYNLMSKAPSLLNSTYYQSTNYYSYYNSVRLLALNIINQVFVISKKIVCNIEKLLITAYKALHLPRAKNNIIDLFVQLYLFINLILLTFAIKIDNKASNMLLDVTSPSSTTAGLGLLKDMLYNQYGSFLIISTLVLLVALIGAAIMTKNNN